MAENVKVIVRCRPMNKKELEQNSKCVVTLKDCTAEIWDPEEGPAFPKRFTFDSVYDQQSTTETVYNEICYPLVESVLEGYNSTIFVYGQTGCGKSFTMEGDRRASPASRGIIPRAFEHVFEAIALADGVKYLCVASYLEIYNEQIRDLLLSGTGGGDPLSLKEVPNEGISIPGLTCKPVHNLEECEALLTFGSKNRMVGSTLMNRSSSRSHSIFTISIEQIAHENSADNNNSYVKKGKLNLVDLAGSERQSKTGATGDRLREATKINLSLSALGNVISALVDGKTKHVPYRDSKLTRILRDSLGGNTRTLMIGCISPSDGNYFETLSTLRYANRAKNISNKPKINEDPKDAILRKYEEEINRLKRLLSTNQLIEDDKVLKNTDTDTHRSPSEEEIRKRIEELKSNMIGGEKIDDKELSERRRRKKAISERRLSAVARVLAKIDLTEDREVLQNQYKDIAHELDLKSDVLRRYRYRVRGLEREVRDLHAEFEAERQDYLETIRKQERAIKLLEQVADRIRETLKKECNYRNLESIKEEAIWIDEMQKFKLPELTIQRTKLPPPDRFSNTQTAPGRLDSTDDRDRKPSDIKKVSDPEELIGSYFRPKRATELLNESSRRAFDTWRDAAANVSNGKSYDDTAIRTDLKRSRPLRLDALPNVVPKGRIRSFECM